MVKKVLWFSLGAAVGAFGYARLRHHWAGRTLTEVNRAVGGVADRVDDAYRTFRQARREREEHLRYELGVGQEKPNQLGRDADGGLSTDTSGTPLVSRRQRRNQR